MSDEQRALRDTVRRLLSRESGSAAVPAAAASPDGFDRALWERLCQEIGGRGWPPRNAAAAWATLAETHVVLGELGRTL